MFLKRASGRAPELSQTLIRPRIAVLQRPIRSRVSPPQLQQSPWAAKRRRIQHGATKRRHPQSKLALSKRAKIKRPEPTKASRMATFVLVRLQQLIQRRSVVAKSRQPKLLPPTPPNAVKGLESLFHRRANECLLLTMPRLFFLEEFDTLYLGRPLFVAIQAYFPRWSYHVVVIEYHSKKYQTH